MQDSRLQVLFQALSDGTLSMEDKEELFLLMANPLHADEVRELLDKKWKNFSHAGTSFEAEDWEVMLRNIINAGKPAAPVRTIGGRRWLRYAAVLLIVLGTGVVAYNFLKTDKPETVVENKPAVKQFHNDIAPPSSVNAYITLADGRKINLDSAGNGILAKEGDAKVIKKGDGLIAYIGNGKEPQFNTLTNPKGSKVVSLTLADGTQVWLNTESSITYPTFFKGNERQVEISGEAYFEVTKNTRMPFLVKKQNDDAMVRVLGTHFNINAYNDEENITVTLLAGSVAVSRGNQERVLQPGQLARLFSTRIEVKKDADMEQIMAWKNGYFNFKGADIKTMMRQIEKWYDLQVVYRDEVKETFYIKMSRNTNISNVFRILEATGGVHFNIENKKVTIKL
jgi:hypothetical protein